MAIEKVINIKVVDGDVTKADKNIQNLDKSINKVEDSTKNAGANISKSFDGAQESASNLQGGVEGVATEIGNVASAAKKGGAAMRSAFISTGIGALIVALGYVVDNWQEISEWIGISNKSIEEQIELLNNKSDLLGTEIDNLEKQQKLLELQGESNESLQKQKIQLLEQQKALNESELRLLETQLLRLESTKTELSIWEQIKGTVSGIVGGTDAVASQASNLAIERQAEIDALKQKIAEAKGEALDLEIALFKANNPQTSGEAPQDRSGNNTIQIEEAGAREVEIAKFISDEKIKILQDELDTKLQLITTSAEQEKLINQAVNDAKLSVAANTLGLLRQIVNEDSAAGKAFAVAQTVISGIQGVQNAFTTAQKNPITAFFPAFPVIQAGLAGAFSALQVKKILSTDPTGRTTPNLGGVGGGGQAAPSFNVVGTSGVNQIAQTLSQDQNPVQAFVVGSNVTSQQALDRNIVETATIG